MKRLAVALLAELLLGAACRGGRHGAAELRIRLQAEPAHLNPLLGVDHVTSGDVYESLVAIGEHAELTPVLATAWTRSPDDREWSFTLRPNVRWHDGTPFTAADVVFTLRLLEQPTLPSSDDFDDLIAVDAPDAATVRVRFGHERAGRDRAFAFVPILPRHVFGAGALAENTANRAPIGTGPYELVAWTPGREIRLERWSNYWGPAPAIARVVYRIVPDANLAVTQLRAGELDVLLQPPPAALAELARDGYQLIPYRDALYWSVRWNCRSGHPTANARVRQALSTLLDRETLSREVFDGRLESVSGPWTRDDPAYNTAVPPWLFDPPAARRLLASAGLEHVSVKLLLPPGTSERIATIWQEDARNAGVTLVLDVDAARAARPEIDDGLLYRWSTDRELDMYPVLHSGQEGNLGGCSDAELDERLVEARTTADARARAHVEQTLHARMHDVEFETIIGLDHAVAVAPRRVHGVAPGVLGAPVRKMSVGD